MGSNAPLRCLVTAGPTYEPLDAVRRLTNFSTGRLGCQLAAHLTDCGHAVWLLIGEQAVWRGERRASQVETFTTTADLRDRLRGFGKAGMDAVFHAAAVSDFSFGAVWSRTETGELAPVSAGKLSTRGGVLLAELKPTPKILAEMRGWFSQARLVGWKYEVDGGQERALEAAKAQIHDCRTDACVANGPAYGPGFALVRSDGTSLHVPDGSALCRTLASEYVAR